MIYKHYGVMFPKVKIEYNNKVFYEGTPTTNRFFDPYSISGQGTLNLVDEFGFGSFSPAAQFILMPIYEDLLRIPSY